MVYLVIYHEMSIGKKLRIMLLNLKLLQNMIRKKSPKRAVKMSIRMVWFAR